MLLSAEHLSKNYGMKQLLQDVSLYLTEKDRIGILGVNGTGKSTLLKILAGIETPDSGSVTVSNALKTVYLPQNPVMHDDFTVLAQVFESAAPTSEAKEYEGKAMLNRLGITDFDAKIGTLSGGQRKRVALAAALMRPADILILDEPTNHLDSEMVCWLEQYLAKLTGGLIMVTHDRYFLERVVNRIAELSRGNLYLYEANYSKYLELKAERSDIANAGERKRQSLLRKESEWIMRGARGRGTKSRERIARYETLQNAAAPQADEAVQMATLSSRLGRKIIELIDVTKSFDSRVIIRDFSYLIARADRIGVIGKNGMGKSTLLNLVAGQLLPDTGAVDAGSTVKIGYFMQECRALDATERVYDFISGIANEIKTNEGTFSASQMLERFLFASDLQYTTIGRLSGGERRRLYLLSILMEAPNVLLLDEPTNDLDIETLTILEDYLISFPGAVLAVSHDRYFLDKIATSIFEVTADGSVIVSTGNYADYDAKRQAAVPVSKPKLLSATPKQDAAPRTRKLKFSYREQQEFETIDDSIAALEHKIAACTAAISAAASDYLRLQTVMAEKSALEAELDAKTERWVYLNELAEKIEAGE
ncbi:MAG: ABC-F family ATP-binding cassette domain-containing protein [Ruthenibacterium sp.]